MLIARHRFRYRLSSNSVEPSVSICFEHGAWFAIVSLVDGHALVHITRFCESPESALASAEMFLARRYPDIVFGRERVRLDGDALEGSMPFGRRSLRRRSP